MLKLTGKYLITGHYHKLCNGVLVTKAWQSSLVTKNSMLQRKTFSWVAM